MSHILDDEYLQDGALIWGKAQLTEKQCDHFRNEFDTLIKSGKYKAPYHITFDGTKFRAWGNGIDALVYEIDNAPNRAEYFKKYRR